ncbi:MAG: NUDIX domain-containing protein [Gammaproteobacteria bacterium]|jgi:bifunctional NMN adenylyltransferase/nudix hydrolase
MFDYAILPGRFQPPHRGHVSMILAGLEQARTVIVACGAAELSRSILRPWTAAERVDMLRALLPGETTARVLIIAIPDNPYRPRRWAATLVRQVNDAIRHDGRDPDHVRLALLGAEGDARARYERWFPQWSWIEGARDKRCDSAALRAELLGCRAADPECLRDCLAEFAAGKLEPAELAVLREEFAANEAFRARWADAPWPPVFVTVDAVVVAARKVLLIERGRFPGRGLWALPGGFLDSGESLRDGCVRELLEETSIDCSYADLVDAIRGVEVFDAPDRSARGRTITHAFRFELDGPTRSVRGGDDAAAARWVALAELRPGRLFEDHYAIVQAMLGVE